MDRDVKMDRILLQFMISGAPDHCDLVDKPFELVIFYLFIIGCALISVVQLESLGKMKNVRQNANEFEKNDGKWTDFVQFGCYLWP